MRFLFALVLLASLEASVALAGGARSHRIGGVHPRFGAFDGSLEIRPRADGAADVFRTVVYRDFRFDGLTVQEVWAGTGRPGAGGVRAIFELKQADLFFEVDDLARTDEQFRAKRRIEYAASFTEGKASWTGPDGARIVERVEAGASAAGDEPPWRDRRTRLRSRGDSHAFLAKILLATAFRPILTKYRDSAFVRAGQSRPECRTEDQFFVLDPTDFEFLRANPGAIRVANKVVDPISMYESALRRAAYAPTLAEKAGFFDRQVEEDHLNELGLFSIAILDERGRVRELVPNGDGALWSGMYAGSQAMRWKATRDPRALANFERVVRGLMLLMDVTGDPEEFARTAHPMKPGEVPSPPWRQGAAPFERVKYMQGGNNDMIKGLFHAFAWAFEILPEGDPLRAEVAAHAARMPRLKPARSFQHVNNRFFATQLAALATGDESWTRQARLAYRWGIRTADLLKLDEGFYYGGIADWSGINLGMVGSLTSVLLTKQMAEKHPGSAAELEALKGSRRNLMELWATYATARRDFLTIAADAFGARDEALGLPPETRPARWPKQEMWASAVPGAVWIMREIPGDYARHDAAFDFTRKPDFCPSLWPIRPWKVFNEDNPIEYYQQAQEQAPLFEAAGLVDDNVWKTSFDYEGRMSRMGRHGRIDFLTVYWMGRLSGLFADPGI